MGANLSTRIRSVSNRFTKRHPCESSSVDKLMKANQDEANQELIREPILKPIPKPVAYPLQTWYQSPEKAMMAPLPPRPVASPSVLYEPQAEILKAMREHVQHEPSSCTSSPLPPHEIEERRVRIATLKAKREAFLQKEAPQKLSSSTTPQETSKDTPLQAIASRKGKSNGFDRAAKLTLRTERHMQRHFSCIHVLEETRSRLLHMFRRKPKAKKRIKKAGCLARLRNWRRSKTPSRPHSPPLPPPPPFPVVQTRGITPKQTLRLSELIHAVTQPPTTTERDLRGPKTQTKPFLMVHQTNEFEIMSTIGSFRLNPQLWAKRDTEGLGYEDNYPYLEELVFEFNDNERMRRMYSYKKENKSLTLRDAYEIGHGMRPVEYGLAEAARHFDKPGMVNQYPVIHSEEPVIGVPFKLHFKDVVDIPEYSIDMFCYMNHHLSQFGVQIIDLRCRYEEILGSKPWIMDERTVIVDVTDSIIRSLDALHSIRTTAKYFVVYAFYSNNVPYRFFQIIVRFKPELSMDSVDWINDGVTRLQIEEDDPEPTIPTPQN